MHGRINQKADALFRNFLNKCKIVLLMAIKQITPVNFDLRRQEMIHELLFRICDSAAY